MTKTKTTKGALLASILSLLLCVSMLIGSTFAWFTDTATTGVNTIQAGTLDIELQMQNGEEWVDATGQTVGFVNEDGVVIENILWEPGCRYLLQPVKVVNNGNLYAKCKFVISAVKGTTNGDVDLASVIDVYEDNTKLGTLRSFLDKANTATGIKEFVVAPNQGEAYLGQLKLVMQETAGNEYQGTSLESIAITVYATQATVEEDSFDNQYDAGALYGNEVAIASQAELDAAIAAANEPSIYVLSNGTYELYNTSYGNKDITIKGVGDDVKIDLTNLGNEFYGGEIRFDNVKIAFPETSHKGLTHTEKVVYNNCTFSGTQTLYAPTEFNNCKFEGNGSKDIYYVWTYGNDATFNNCTFTTGGKAILCYFDSGSVESDVTLNDCSFTSDGTAANDKAVVEVGSDYNIEKYNITFTNCTQTGFTGNPKGTPTGSPLWGNKNSMSQDLLNVVIDGVEVY